MNYRFMICGVVPVAVSLGTFIASPQAPTPSQDASKGKAKSGNVGLYQRQPPTPTGPVPKFADGTPDLSGVWLGSGSNDSDISRGLKPGESVSMLPWAAELVKNRQSAQDPEANCLPAGVPRGSPYPWRIMQTPTLYAILF